MTGRADAFRLPGRPRLRLPLVVGAAADAIAGLLR